MFADLIERGKEKWGLIEFGTCEGDGSTPSGNGACLDEGYTPWAIYEVESRRVRASNRQELKGT